MREIMNGWALWFAFLCGADVATVLPVMSVCDERSMHAQIAAGKLQLMHEAMGGYSLEYRFRVARLQSDFWAMAARFQSGQLDIYDRLKHARELRRMMGWTR